jgi:hypothetical protein
VDKVQKLSDKMKLLVTSRVLKKTADCFSRRVTEDNRRVSHGPTATSYGKEKAVSTIQFLNVGADSKKKTSILLAFSTVTIRSITSLFKCCLFNCVRGNSDQGRRVTIEGDFYSIVYD